MKTLLLCSSIFLVVFPISFVQSLAEKGGPDLERITAHPNFFLLATMNPGGDYGKKELSPALRNRFTEIWVPTVSDPCELRRIAEERYQIIKHVHIVTFYIETIRKFSLKFILCRISDPDLFFLVELMLKFWKVCSALSSSALYRFSL